MNSEILAYLLLAYAASDHVFGDREAAARRHAGDLQPGEALGHVPVVVLCHLVAVLPAASGAGAALSVGVAVAHTLIEALRSALPRRSGAAHLSFAFTLLAHLVVVVAAAAQWDEWTRAIVRTTALEADVWLPALSGEVVVARAAVVAAAGILAARAGSVLVATTLEELRATPPDDGELRFEPRLGRAIGVLERLVVVTLVLVDAWGGIGLILAAKSVARFKELESRAFSEYYLVGTLTSVLVAILTGLGASLALGAL